MNEDSKTISELTGTWYEDRAHDQQSPLREASLRNIQVHVESIKRKIGHLKIGQLKESDCVAYIHSAGLDGKEISPKTKERRQSYLLQFIYWCISQKYLEVNPMARVPRVVVPAQMPSFLSVDNCMTLLAEVVNEIPEVLGYLSLALFCGTRPEETAKLQWENIDFAKNELFVPAEVAKNRKDRRQPITINCRICLLFFRAEGYRLLIPRGFRGCWQKVKPRLEFDWSHDVLRHTFATYHYAWRKNADLLSEYMGVDRNLIVKYYKRNIPTIEISRFWSISTNTKGILPKPLF